LTSPLSKDETRVVSSLELCFYLKLNTLTLKMIQHTQCMKREINDKLSHFHGIIARHRQRSSLAKKTIGVSPQVTIDVLQHTLNVDELAYLSRGKINPSIDHSFFYLSTKIFFLVPFR